MQARGINAIISYMLEAAFNTDPATPAMTKLIFNTDSLGLNQNMIVSSAIQSRNPTMPGLGNKDVKGTINLELQAYIGTLLKAALGSCTTSGEAAPYTHTIKIGSPSIPSLVIEKGFPDLTVPEYFKYNGCKINKMTLQIRPEGFQMLALDIVGAKETVGAAPFDATIDDLGKYSWLGFEISAITEGGVAIATVMEADLTLENGLDDKIYPMGSLGTRAGLPEGQAKVSGKIKAMFDSMALYSKAIAGTETSLAVTYTFGSGAGTTGNESLAITVPELKYSPQTPPIAGPGGLFVELPFTGYYSNDVNASALMMVLKNTQVSL